MPQTKTEIRTMLDRAGLRANRRLGQHFLIDGNLMTKLVDAADIGSGDVVLEVGAGTGSLTALLLERAGIVVAVEIDRGLCEQAAGYLSERDNLTLLHADALASKSVIAEVVLDALREAGRELSRGETAPAMLLVANLPYQVATPLLIDLLTCGVLFSRFCFSVQKEVADRILSDHGNKVYGPLSVILQSCCSMEKLFSLPPQVFWPPPNVESSALRLDVDMSNFETPEDLKGFIALVRRGFAHRRKTLHYNLKGCCAEEVLQGVCADLGIDLRWRAEQLPVIKWLELYDALQCLA